jgi:hypothetical protein
MTMKVRRRRLMAVTFLAGASLLHSSMSIASDARKGDRNLSLRVPSTTVRTLNGVLEANDISNVWAAPSSTRRAERAARGRVSGAPDGMATEGRVVSVAVTLGRADPAVWLTNAGTAAQLLAVMGIRLADTDVVRPYLTAPLSKGAAIRVVRVRLKVRTVTTTVPFRTLIQHSTALADGEVAVITPGVPGTAVQAYRLLYRNGRIASRVLLSRRIVAPPVNQVEQHGTAAATPGTGSECGIASWYNRSTTGAANKTLPFGTHVTVTNLDNGQTVTVTIDDRGPFVAGRIIDLSPDAFAQIAPLGQGLANVCIHW